MTTQVVTTWKKEWFEIEDATYLNTAAHTVMPRVPIRAVEHALEAKKFPHRVATLELFTGYYVNLPKHFRAYALALLIASFHTWTAQAKRQASRES